ncbi:PREDICTED: uncharacterized protein LOC104714485 [Camelina sativa]|uniref:Uncharacterized protein LOC104714485 n=1 Tax=Camelina sativa TaxID=90675 RepID=A0ABM0TRI8_CAMSA|nr:PREDICTED: uncharacterized protein LOC104714485 [Camelina sativa]
MNPQQREVSTLQAAAQELTIATEASQPCDEEKKRAEKAMDPQQREVSPPVTIKEDLETFLRLQFELLRLHTTLMEAVRGEEKVAYMAGLQKMRVTVNDFVKRASEDFKEDEKKLETVAIIKTRISTVRTEIRKLKNQHGE